MLTLPKSIDRLINQMSQLPGIGQKTASRLTFFLIRNNGVDLDALGAAFMNLKTDLVYCSNCHNISDHDPCDVCSDSARDHTLICVIEDALDLIALERSGFRGLYHVLGGQISPMEGIGPNELNIASLVERVRNAPEVKEVIIATNPNVEGEATASYITKLLTELEVKVTRIARGLPMGSDLEYADEMTLHRALEGRNEVVY